MVVVVEVGSALMDARQGKARQGRRRRPSTRCTWGGPIDRQSRSADAVTVLEMGAGNEILHSTALHYSVPAGSRRVEDGGKAGVTSME